MQPIHTIHCQQICRKQLLTNTVAMSSETIITTCYPYQNDVNYPITRNDWFNLHTPLFTVQPVPVIIPQLSSMFTTNITPLVGTVVQPVLSQILPQTFVQDFTNISNYVNEYIYPTQQVEITELSKQYFVQSEIESYLSLPKELFPAPSMIGFDPNLLIDEFCKMPNLQRHMPWILDLEFGIPKSPITRPIPTYNVKFNSIHCKNAPDAIHPGFESCDPDFKKMLLFYYDSIVSAWYKGYMIMHSDRSVENFQSWLLLPMQVLGMCWP